MNFKNQIFILSLLASFCVIPVDIAHSAGEDKLISIQQKFATSIKPEFEAYYRELSELEKSLAGQNNIEGSQKVRLEIEKVEGQLKGITTLINYRPVPLPVEKPAPAIKPPPVEKPAVSHKPKTHISSTQGIAGAPKFSKNNIYSFSLSSTGKKSTLTFYATGRRSTDTKGRVFLVRPNGEKIKVSQWKEKNFKYTSKEAQTYKRLKPITADLSGLVTNPGLYKIEFSWTGGIDPLVIYRVELTS